HARGAGRRGARPERGCRGDRRRLCAGGKRMSAQGATVRATTAAQKQRRLQHGLAQNVPLILALTILIALTALYVGLFHGQLHRYPGVFEWTSIVNTAMPIVLVAVGKSIVVITRWIDLSLGGIIDVSNSLAAVHMHSGLGSMVAWSGVVLLF